MPSAELLGESVEFDAEGGGTLTLNVPFGSEPDPQAKFREMVGKDTPIPVPLERLAFTPLRFRAWQFHGKGGVEWFQHWTFRIDVVGAPEPWRMLLDALQRPERTHIPRPNLKTKPGPNLWVVMGDDQAPFVNEPLHALTCEALADMDVCGFVYTGDGVDYDALTSHAPKPTAFVSDIQGGLDSMHRLLGERIDAAKPTEAYYLAGNHEQRMDRQLLKWLPQLYGIKEANSTEQPLLRIDRLLRLQEMGVTYVTDELGDYPHGTVSIADDLKVSHGWIARKGAGNSARATVESMDSGIIVGHTHRLAVSHVTRWNGEPKVYTAAEAGTLADLRGLQYTRHPDWQPGWLTVEVHADGHHVDLVRYQNGVLTWRDRRWELTPRGVRR